MTIHLSACLCVVSVWLVRIFLYSIVDGMRHLLLRLVCIIVGLSWSKSAVWDKVLEGGAIPEAIVVEVCCARWSPTTRGRSLRPFVVKVCCARQSPPMRGSFLRPSVVKVHCARQSTLRRGSSWGHLWSKSACARQSPPTRGSSWGPRGQSLLCETKSSNERQILEALVVKVHCTW